MDPRGRRGAGAPRDAQQRGSRMGVVDARCEPRDGLRLLRRRRRVADRDVPLLQRGGRPALRVVHGHLLLRFGPAAARRSALRARDGSHRPAPALGADPRHRAAPSVRADRHRVRAVRVGRALRQPRRSRLLPGGRVIEWAAPWAFALLIPVLALPFRSRWLGRGALAVPGAEERVGGRTLRQLVAWLPEALFVLGLLCLVLALARPRMTVRETVVESDGLDILLTLDTSGSMRETDLSTSLALVDRLTVAKKVIEEFVAGRPYDRIGLVVFGEEAFTQVPLTLDHEALVDVLEYVRIGTAGPGATAIGQALAVSGRRMNQIDAPSRIVILLTDGRNNAGRISPIDAAEASAALGIRVYTIGVGARGADGLDEPTLRAVAEATGGRYFRADSANALQEIFDLIDELETSPAEVTEYANHIELYRRWAIPGLVLLLLQFLLGQTWLRRGP
ncbi:MAG: VWA domain-containing protein [Deltaproteobacteria bacterium]|nr:MAG: VWA domain-containing protein [Deltaproteobacteria bacterium]